MKRTFDVAVIGLGGMGSAVLAHAAIRGMRSIGFEQFARGHDQGASSGRSRMIRKAYYEHPAYVPLLERAYQAWRETERSTGATLMNTTGLLMVGGQRSAILEGALLAARRYALAVEELSAAAVRARFPRFVLRADERAVFEPDGGFIVPESAISAFLLLAQEAGAQMRFGVRAQLEQLLEIASSVVVCAGPWLEEVQPELPVRVERNVQHWFEPLDEAAFALGRFPAFLYEREDFPAALYGIPDYGFGVKAAFHGSGATTHAAQLDRGVYEDDVAPVRAALDAVLPGAAGAYRDGKVCMYACTPDAHFIVCPHPSEPRVIIAGGFSGHGFKFVPVVAEIVADMVSGTRPPYDVGLFSAARFGSSAG